MPTHVRLLLTLTPEAATDAANAHADAAAVSHVYDVSISAKRRSSTLEAVRGALSSLPAATPEERPLRELLLAALKVPPAAQARADVPLQGLGVCMQGVNARGPVLEGIATFAVADKLLPSCVRAVNVTVGANGLQLALVALVYGGNFAGARPEFHFLGAPSGKLVDLRTLATGKKSVVATASASGTSHFLRRAGQLQAHAAAMQDLGVAVHVPRTLRAHTPLLDTYVSHAEHQGRALMCVSVFA